MNGSVRKQILKIDGEPVLALSLRRPDLSSDGRSMQAIERYYKQLRDTWQRRWETGLFSAAAEALKTARAESRPFQPWQATLDFVVTYEDETTLSLYLDAVVHGPALHPLIVRSADTWDVKSGAPITLSAVLPPALRKRKALFPMLKQQAANQLAAGDTLFFEDVQARIERAFSPDRFYISKAGAVLFFPMLCLGSAAERIPIFPLS